MMSEKRRQRMIALVRLLACVGFIFLRASIYPSSALPVGIRNIIDEVTGCDTKTFPRLKVGIGRPPPDVPVYDHGGAGHVESS
jgi:hypothetical protein